ncbi:MAG: hypothetical protein HOD97_03580 [Candidatus Marinimicrobia bacterium]|jgi:hypothetical protein|nr:hypothetical protein [Candidatus Neomarinimicrobiota bacterium]MBT3617700.1 hypothetical protein [Candidatus Neomarinimicrobiota bacterium]MBT3828425.1 hypothetical protein [Candidatus Neomarinimicrobiota bacterium]MBT3997521.1 hypothetical protein [Candidatus Neomarinimicrobiota bacterium]MBT4280682.1 hypothetical protein [Candidatus Neomarinimicrobiota bacterium]
MMKLENIIDDVVLLVLDNHEPLKELGIDQNKIYAKVLGYDDFGVWVLHPGINIPSPVGKKKKSKSVEASVLIPWPYISSVVHFPNVEGFDFPNPFEMNIGFDIN